MPTSDGGQQLQDMEIMDDEDDEVDHETWREAAGKVAHAPTTTEREKLNKDLSPLHLL